MRRKSIITGLGAIIGTGLAGCATDTYKVYSNSVIKGERGDYRIESEPEYVFSSVDLTNQQGQLIKDGIFDVYAIGSVYINPAIKEFWTTSEGLPNLFREGAPGIEIYYTPDFARNLKNNPSLLKSLNEIISTKYDFFPETLTPEKLDILESKGPRTLLPRNHIENMPEERKLYLEGIRNGDSEIMALIEREMEYYSRMAEGEN